MKKFDGCSRPSSPDLRDQEITVTDPLVVHTSGLQKAYGPVEALRGLDLAVPAGSIFGFLGRNGAGKTTTMKVLLGMARPTGGEARVFGLDAADARASVAIRRRAAFVSEDKDLIDYMTIDEIVAFAKSFFPQWDRALEQRYRRQFDLRGDQRVRTLSRGTRSKLALTLALCRGAELLLLDEPTSGLDPAAADEVLQAIVSHVASRPLTVLFSSHQLAEVDQIADHVAIIDRGRTVVSRPLDDLHAGCRRIHIVFEGDAPEVAFQAPGVAHIRRSGRVLTVLASAGAEAIVSEARGLDPVSIDVVPVTLKEIFLDSVNAEE
jgi:ABC-2 type transport system ATP-binding protein